MTSSMIRFRALKALMSIGVMRGMPRLDGRGRITDTGAELAGVEPAVGGLLGFPAAPQGNRIAELRWNGGLIPPKRLLNLLNVLERIPKHPGREIDRPQQPGPLPTLDALNTASPAGRQLAAGNELAGKVGWSGRFGGSLHGMKYRPVFEQAPPWEESGRVATPRSATSWNPFNRFGIGPRRFGVSQKVLKEGSHPRSLPRWNGSANGHLLLKIGSQRANSEQNNWPRSGRVRLFCNRGNLRKSLI